MADALLIAGCVLAGALIGLVVRKWRCRPRPPHCVSPSLCDHGEQCPPPCPLCPKRD